MDFISLLRKFKIPLIVIGIFLFAVLLVWPWFNFPINDDWVYALDVVKSMNTGGITFSGLETAWAIPQIFLAKVLMFSSENIHIYLRIVAIIFYIPSIWFLYLLLSSLVRDQRIIFFTLLGVVFFPPIFFTSMTFMTESLFLTLIIGTLYFFEKALSEKKLLFLFVGFIFCLLAILQRQLAVILFLPLSIFFLLSFYKNRLFSLIGLTGILVLSAVYVLISVWWKNSIKGPEAYLFIGGSSLGSRIRDFHAVIFFTGILLFPVSQLYIYNWRKIATVGNYIFISGIILITVIRFWFGKNSPFVGNLFSRFGLFDENQILMGQRQDVLSIHARVVICILAFTFLLHILANRSGIISPRRWLSHIINGKYRIGVLSIIFSVTYVIIVLLRGVFFDRYIIPAVPGLIFIFYYIVDNAPTTRKSYAAILASMILMIFNVTLVKDYFAWNQARWELGREAVATGILPGEIDGGYEWNGWEGQYIHAHSQYVSSSTKYVMSFSEKPEMKTLYSKAWTSLWFPYGQKIYLLQK